MQWYCRFTWFQGTTSEKVRQRVLEQDQAGRNHPDKIKGWYNLAGGGAGFLIVETDDARELTELLEPYMDLMAWDVHAIYPLDYQEATERFREAAMAR